jgi:hypothetical protein
VDLIVKRSFAVGAKVYRRKTRVPADDPVVKGREHLFDQDVEVIERATAAPGEKRVTPPRKKPAAKKPAAGSKTKKAPAPKSGDE